jgi:Co/Zn/Cd efflux system component
VTSNGPATGNRLKIAGALNARFVIVEFGVGLWADSLTPVSDSGHTVF